MQKKAAWGNNWMFLLAAACLAVVVIGVSAFVCRKATTRQPSKSAPLRLMAPRK
jgi:hypothetical protein